MIKIYFPIVKNFDNGSVIAFKKPFAKITKEILKESVSLSPGYLYTISGDNGTGKTTLMNILSLLTGFSGKTLSNSDSSLIFKGKHNESNGNEQSIIEDPVLLRSNILSFIFQDPHLINIYSIEENLKIVNPFFNYVPDLIEIKEKINGLSLDKETRDFLCTKMDDLIFEADETPYYLSGGEKQLLSFIRAMIKPSNILFADEPWASMDKHLKTFIVSQMYQHLSDDDIFSFIRNRNRKLKASKIVLVISHPSHNDTIAKDFGTLDSDWTKVIPVKIGEKKKKANVNHKLSLYRYKCAQ